MSSSDAKVGDRIVRAAGGVVWRRGPDDDPELLLVHRPVYDDWSFPKGKCEPGETDEVCAVREMEEETGLRCELGVELRSVSYIDRKGRPKAVRYWASEVRSGRFQPNTEVDEIRWMAVPEASELLTYDRDRDVVKDFVRRAWSRQTHPSSHAGSGGDTASTGSTASTAQVGEAVPYHSMSPDEQRSFLTDPARPGVLATVRADGRPHATPVWFALDGDDVVFTTGADTVKGRNLARDPRATLCVQDDQPPYSFVTLEGTVELIDDLDEVRDWATRLGARYMGEEAAASYGSRNGVPGELVVRFRPVHAVSARDLAD